MKADKVKLTYGFKIGSQEAPVKVIEFLNLRCPYCKKWYFDSKQLLAEYVDRGQIQRVVKLLDKETVSLKKGNVAHHHLDYKDPEKALEEIEYFLEHQDEWGNLERLDQVAQYAVEKRGLKHQPNDIEINGILQEAEEANVVLVPSVFIGEHIFDEHISQEELKEIMDSEIAKKS